MWYKFEARNQETYYGWTTSDDVLLAALEWLNLRRDIHLYFAEELGEDRPDLEARTDLIMTDDSRPDDYPVSLDDGD